MNRNPKTFCLFSLVILFVFSAKSSLAQYPGMQAVYNRMNMQNQQMRMNSLMNMNYNNGPANVKYPFLVVFKDSSKKVVLSKIFLDTSNKKTYLLLVDKSFSKKDMAHREQKIYTDQTINISRIASSGYLNNRVYITGIPTDSCWMFKALSGAINVYSYLSENEGIGFDPETIVGIQLNDGPIVKFNEENLKQMVSNDKDALDEVNKKKLYKAVKRYNKDMEKAAKK